MTRRPAETYPLDLADVASTFDVRHARTGGVFKNIIGLRMKSGATRYRCRFCPDVMYLEWGHVKVHVTAAHPETRHRGSKTRPAPDPATVRRPRRLRQRQGEPAEVLAEAPSPEEVNAAIDAAIADTEASDTYVSSDAQEELDLGVELVPLAAPARANGRPARMAEANLDKLAPVVATSVADLVEQYVRSRAQARADLDEVMTDRNKYRAQRDHALATLRKVAMMIDGLVTSLESDE